MTPTHEYDNIVHFKQQQIQSEPDRFFVTLRFSQQKSETGPSSVSEPAPIHPAILWSEMAAVVPAV